MSLMTAKEIMEIIPHRQPFMLIDTIEELAEGKKAVAKQCSSGFYLSAAHKSAACIPCLLWLPVSSSNSPLLLWIPGAGF